jgi:hypothetical protein
MRDAIEKNKQREKIIQNEISERMSQASQKSRPIKVSQVLEQSII